MTFEERFFGPGNRLRWEVIRRGSLPPDVLARLGPFLDELRRDPEVLILPRAHGDGRVQWYVLCASTRVARVARDELRAFLGPSYSDFEGRPTLLDPGDPVEAAVLERCGANAFRLEVPEPQLVPVARERLQLLVHLRAERPQRHAKQPRATGRILRDFEYALLTGDGTTAAELIAELRTSGRLDAVNLLFLEVRRLAALGSWEATLELPELGALLGMRRPRRVSQVLIHAVYAEWLRRFEERARPVEAVEFFRKEVLPRYGELYRSRAGLHGHEVDASFLLRAVASDPPCRELADTILAERTAGTPGQEYLVSIAALMPGSASARVPAQALQRAREAFVHGDVDGACAMAIGLPASFERCALLLRCASEMGTLAATQAALAAVESLPASERERLGKNAVLARIYGTLVSVGTAAPQAAPTTNGWPGEVPASWPAWLRRLQATERWHAAVPVAEAAAREWRLSQMVADPAQVADTAALLLAERSEWGRTALHDALPHLIEFFLAEGPDPRLDAVYRNLFVILTGDDLVSFAQFRALVSVAEARLGLELAADDYRTILTQLTQAVDRLPNRYAADLVLDAAELLSTAPCPDRAARQRFVRELATCFRHWHDRLDAVHWRLLCGIAEEVGVADVLLVVDNPGSVGSAPSLWSAINGARIAIRSSRQPALERVESMLRSLGADVVVKRFDDASKGSAVGRTTATTAELVIEVSTVVQNRVRNLDEVTSAGAGVILHARGQGSASILAVLLEHLQSASNAAM